MRAFSALSAQSLRRIARHRNASSLAYSISEKGALSTAQVDVATVSGDGVQIRWIAAGVNELDFSRAGNIGGSEGAGIVESVGSSVTKVKPGDLVIPVKVRCLQLFNAYLTWFSLVLELGPSFRF